MWCGQILVGSSLLDESTILILRRNVVQAKLQISECIDIET